jgi:hypothetical protein
MKRVFILLVILVSFGPTSWASGEKADVAAIKATVADYLEGWFSSDPERMSRALHPNLSKCTIKQIPRATTEYLDIMSAEALVAFTKNNAEWVKDKKTHSMKIIYQDDHFALVHAVSDDFYDICGLAKVNGEWKLVHVLWAMNKTEKQGG